MSNVVVFEVSEEVLACRGCLALDVKLYSIHNHRLAEAYADLLGTQVSILDGLPQYLCYICSSLLLKCANFKAKCRNAQDLLEDKKVVTTTYIRGLDRSSHNLATKFNTHTETISYPQDTQNVIEKIQEEPEVISFINNFTPDPMTETSSDEEIKIVKKPKPKKVLDKKKVTEKKVEKIDVKKKKKINVALDKKKKEEEEKERKEEARRTIFETTYNVERVELSKEEQIAEVQSRMNSSNYMNSPYKCSDCFKGFTAEDAFKNHQTIHDPLSGSHVCDICHARYITSNKLRLHLSRHRIKYVCKQCQHESRSDVQAKSHFRWHGGLKYECTYCGKTFDKPTTRLTHVRRRHPTELNWCELCGDSFIGDIGLREHRKKAHREVLNGSPECRCNVCETQFQNYSALQKHINTSPNAACTNTHKSCVQCGENFPTELLLRDHVTQKHRKGNKFKCEMCEKTFVTDQQRVTHQRLIHRLNKTRLYTKKPEGMVVVTKPRPVYDRVMCETCGKICRNGAFLRYHQRTHTGERPYRCTECPKSYTVPYFLQYHMRTHNGERPYKCPHCTKAFKHLTALNRHSRVHTGAKPYACPHCSKAFSQSNSMKVHVMTVHLKLPEPYKSKRKARAKQMENMQ